MMHEISCANYDHETRLRCIAQRVRNLAAAREALDADPDDQKLQADLTQAEWAVIEDATRTNFYSGEVFVSRGVAYRLTLQPGYASRLRVESHRVVDVDQEDQPTL